MALNNPINFFRTDEATALTKKGLKVGTDTATTAVTFVDSPNNTSHDAIEANDATGDGAIFIEGKKVIQGVSVLEKKYLYDQLATKEKARYRATSISVTPTSGSWGFDTKAIDVTFIFEAQYDDAGTSKVTSQTIGSTADTPTAGTPVTGNDGQYSKTITCTAAPNGSQSLTANFSFTYNNTGYGDVTKTASASFTRKAYSVVINTNKGEKPTAEQIIAAKVKLQGIRSLTQYQTTANKDMWVCTPGYDTWTSMTSKGFGVPFDEEVTTVKVNDIVNYNCRRKSSIPEGALIENIVVK